MLRTFRKGGVHPPENKLTSGVPITPVIGSKEYVVALSQHIGAPAECCVNVGDHVAKYQLIGKAQGAVSANVHSPVSGTVKKVEKRHNSFGFSVLSVVIIPEGNDEMPMHSHTDVETDALSPEEIKQIIADAGIVGMGGATFPTYVKLNPPAGTHVDTLLINGAECEPFLTNDEALMRERPDKVVRGVQLLMRAVGVDRAIIAIEANKPLAVKTVRQAAALYPEIEVSVLKVKYPQGGEKQLIDAALHRQVPSGGLPASVGVIVQNVATAYAVSEAVCNGIPLVRRITTVTGPGVSYPGNYEVLIGTPLADIIEAAGGMPADTQKVILGGPMMGKAASNLLSPSTKGLSGIVLVPQNKASREEPENCVRCASCVVACPMGLEPYLLARLSELRDYERLVKERVVDCIECGSCSYICMSHRPLLDFIRIGKSQVVKLLKAMKTEKHE